jgi:hypothetical protein
MGGLLHESQKPISRTIAGTQMRLIDCMPNQKIIGWRAVFIIFIGLSGSHSTAE